MAQSSVSTGHQIDLFGLTSDETSTVILYGIVFVVIVVIISMIYGMYCLPDNTIHFNSVPLERVVAAPVPPMPRSPYSISMRDLNDRESQRFIDPSVRSDRFDSFVDVPLTDNHLEHFSLHNPHESLLRPQVAPGTPYRQ